jgi:hypothetical protein
MARNAQKINANSLLKRVSPNQMRAMYNKVAPNVQQLLRQNAAAQRVVTANNVWMRLPLNQKLAILRGARLIQ